MQIWCKILAAAIFAVVASSHPGGDDAIGNESLTVLDDKKILVQENKYQSFAEIAVICYIKHDFFGGEKRRLSNRDAASEVGNLALELLKGFVYRYGLKI